MIKVLVVDDSALARRLIRETLEADPELSVVSTAADAFEANQKIQALNPDVMTLDVDLPRLDGVEFLRRLMFQRPVRTVVVSSLTARGSETALRALAAGAVDVVGKPGGDSVALNEVLAELRKKVKGAASANLRRGRTAAPPRGSGRTAAVKGPGFSTERLLALGASTGGTEALQAVLERLPFPGPATVIVQHMPAGFISTFATRLGETTGHPVCEARHGMLLRPGQIAVAAAGRQLKVRRVRGTGFRLVQGGSDKVSGHSPSVDVMFQSLVEAKLAPDVVAALLTGMGRDGAEGLLALRRAGAHTIAEAASSCVVYGMPKAAVELGAATEVLPLQDVGPAAAKRLARGPGQLAG